MKHYRVTFDDDRDFRPRVWRTGKWSEHRFLLNIKIVRIISSLSCFFSSYLARSLVQAKKVIVLFL